MKKSFPQANGDETQTTVGVTQKFIKIRATKTNVVRPSGIQSTGLASDGSLGTGPSKLVDHEVAKLLKMLKLSYCDGHKLGNIWWFDTITGESFCHIMLSLSLSLSL